MNLHEKLIERMADTKSALKVFEEENDVAKQELQKLLVNLLKSIEKILDTNEGVALFEVHLFMKRVAQIVTADRDVERTSQNIAEAARLVAIFEKLLKENT